MKGAREREGEREMRRSGKRVSEREREGKARNSDGNKQNNCRFSGT